jgi:hypothetical protein
MLYLLVLLKQQQRVKEKLMMMKIREMMLTSKAKVVDLTKRKEHILNFRFLFFRRENETKGSMPC